VSKLLSNPAASIADLRSHGARCVQPCVSGQQDLPTGGQRVRRRPSLMVIDATTAAQQVRVDDGRTRTKDSSGGYSS
jgi:hypothetical protein